MYPRKQWIIMDKMNSILSTKKKERKKIKWQNERWAFSSNKLVKFKFLSINMGIEIATERWKNKENNEQANISPFHCDLFSTINLWEVRTHKHTNTSKHFYIRISASPISII